MDSKLQHVLFAVNFLLNKSDSRAEGVPGARPGCGFRAVFHVPIRGIRAGRDL